MISVPVQHWHEWPLTHNADLSTPRGSADPFWRGAFCNSTLGCLAVNNMLTVTTLSPSLAYWPSSCFLLHSLTTAGKCVTYSAQEMLTPPNMISPCGHTLYLLGQSSIVHRMCVLWFWCSVIKHTQHSSFYLPYCPFFLSRLLFYSTRNVRCVDQQTGCVWCSCWAPVRRPKKDKVVEKQPRCHFHSCTLHQLPAPDWTCRPFPIYSVFAGTRCVIQYLSRTVKQHRWSDCIWVFFSSLRISLAGPMLTRWNPDILHGFHLWSQQRNNVCLI